jgi:hypothetical protein
MKKLLLTAFDKLDWFLSNRSEPIIVIGFLLMVTALTYLFRSL